MTKLLHGARILVTRPVHQSENICKLIIENGGIPIRYPALEIVNLYPSASATFPAEKLSKLQWAIFTSVNAVNFALQGNSGKIRQFDKVNIAAIGKATANALKAAGLKVNLIPEDGYNSEALLATLPMQQVEGSKILLVRGQGGRQELANELSKRGADVEFLEVYKRIVPKHNNAEIYPLLTSNTLAAVIVTSGEALENLLVMIGEQYKNLFKNILLVVISDRIKGIAEKMGFNKIAVSANPSDSAIVNKLAIAINGDKSG